MKFPVLDIKGKESGSVDLPDNVFNEYVNTEVLHQAIVMYRASQRQGTVSTKGRSEVSGGGKKPFKQKGTGRARAGSSRSPLWHGGGVVFGPKPRDFSFTLPKKIRQKALIESLNSKLKEENVLCVEDLKIEYKKTKEFAKVLQSLGLNGRILAILDGSDQSIERVAKNISSLDLMRVQDVNAYDVLSHKKILITKTAIQQLMDRIVN